ncbi:MAG: hypothetical protein A3G18_00185 [Rhodospirillales bacterium RIFCSPLOWO2_12_FULL_58_28]|nr:MAG: hypothetical protein A3H92_02795 [Rhodospirillales bacterium RIFCSPLOWO2_02_FULL_58_16]OHC79886.1 MAG: hypothetical protein A3G18_00185 [Rhodospirillales bacterium RIFCSPLOWO2_12_FULL_58_28]
MLAKISEWLDERVGLRDNSRRKMGQAVPAHMFFYCFGGISLFIIALQALTGVYMLFFYTPHPELALKSIEAMSNDGSFGWFFRNMHRWGATVLLAAILTHVVTVFYQKAYRRPRELNWTSGVLQFLVVVLLLATGIILPWDWRAYWSFALWVDYFETWPVVGDFLKNLLLDTFTINRAFVIHVLILPIVLVLLLRFHFAMVRRHGISEPL